MTVATTIIYDILLLILFVVVLSLFVLHLQDESKIEILEDRDRQKSEELKRMNSRLNRFEVRFQKIKEGTDRIEIVHKYDDSDAPDFPNSKED